MAGGSNIDQVLADLARATAKADAPPHASAPAKRLSMHAYAALRGLTRPAVQRAIKDGRLTARSVQLGSTGRWTIDVEEADREWAANTVDLRPPKGHISVPAFARLVGVTQPAVRKAIDEGRIGPEAVSRTASGRISLDATIAQQHWRERTDPMRSKVTAPPSVPAGEAVPGAYTASRLPVDAAGRPLSLQEIKSIREAGMIEIERVKLAEMQALLVRTREVAQRWREKCRIARDRILAVAAREANALAAITDPVAHEIAHERALRESLTALADDFSGEST